MFLKEVQCEMTIFSSTPRAIIILNKAWGGPAERLKVSKARPAQAAVAAQGLSQSGVTLEF